jgi:large subunit ribosomal protein L29
MKTEELRDKKLEELRKLLAEKTEELAKIEFALRSAEESNITKKKYIRRDIARINTIVNEKLMSEALDKQPEVKAEVKSEVKAKTKEIKTKTKK